MFVLCYENVVLCSAREVEREVGREVESERKGVFC